jgi:hypothetical protein
MKDHKKGSMLALVLGLKPKMAKHEARETEDEELEEHGHDAEEARKEGIALAAEVREALSGDDDEALYDALHALFMHCDALPHVEGEHEEDEGDEDEDEY